MTTLQKRWVCFDSEFPGGLVFETREDALEYSAKVRWDGEKAYVRMRMFTAEELKEIREAD